MRRLLQDLRDRLRTTAQAWILRRQGRDLDPVILRRNRIYILPTRMGLAYAAMLFAMLLGGMNYNNNLGLALTFLLVGLGLVTMHHCHGTLTGLRLRLVAAEPGFVGDDLRFRWLLENDAGVPRPALQLEVQESAAGLSRHARTRTTATELAARGAVEATVELPATRRGHVALERLVVATSHPLGLFRAWAVLHPMHSAIAWPRPAGGDRDPPRTATDTGGAQSQSTGEEDFAGLRPFQQGDSLRRVAWKAYARGQGLHSKQYAGTDVVSHVFDWDSLPSLGTEARLAQLCRWVIDANERGEAFGLRLPGTEIETNLGTAHRERCLNALALFEPAGAVHG
jgi:uncharacterized protein (DUF58 family)